MHWLVRLNKQSVDSHKEVLLASVQDELISCFSIAANDSNLYVNITVTCMMIKMYRMWTQKNEFCFSGGFTAVLTKQDLHTESSIMCENITKNTTEGRSFYSQGSRLNLVLFWNSENILIKVSTEVSFTHCKAITVDLCLLSLCWSDKDNLITRYCLPHLRYIFQSLDIDVKPRIPETAASQNRPHIMFFVDKENCVIFQFRRNVEWRENKHATFPQFAIEHCSLVATFPSKRFQSKELRFVGSLTPVPGEAQCQHFNRVVDPKHHKLTIEGPLHKLHLQSTNTNHSKLNFNRTTLHLTPGCEGTKSAGSLQLSREDNHFLTIDTTFPKYSDTWIDLIIRNTFHSGTSNFISYFKMLSVV